MKIGLSSYSFRPLLANGSMGIDTMFDWLMAHEAEHLEIATFSFAEPGKEAGYDLAKDEAAVKKLVTEIKRTAIPISGICMAANFIGKATAERQEQINQVKRHIELCNRLEVGHLRHDVVLWSHRGKDTAEFEDEFSDIVDACHEIAVFAAGHGVITSIEDHGFFMNGSERVKRLVHAVDQPNFKITLDVGNFLCVDEDSLTATRACLAQTGFLHLKDFYVRRESPGPGWLQTLGGQAIRGSVFGYGDMPTAAIIKSIFASGYDGFISLEYEGNEPTLFGCETGLGNIRRMLAELTS